MDDAWRARILDPPLQTAGHPGTGGRIRRRPQDFRVEEVPAYAPDGQAGAHLLLTMTKRELSSEDVAQLLAKHLGIDRRELGMAGRKDRVAVTTQWMSVPAAAGPKLASFSHPQIELGPPQPHGNKLRTGHLHGNRFTLVIRELAVTPRQAAARAQTVLDALVADGGLANFYGPQRFGREGHQLDRGLVALRAGRPGRRGNLVVSAGQSALFNLTALLRRDRGQWRTVLAGDLLRKVATGGMFECTDPVEDQARFDAGELRMTGPMFGSRMRGPSEGTPSAALEAEALALAGVEPSALAGLGRKAAGTRRPLTLPVEQWQAEPAPAVPEAQLGPGLCVRFMLPAGSYATQLCREVMGDDQQPANIDPD
ncbi:MAG: tRNA pseudouridine(13) synthase TruD [Deltaproteobacteria bacterium]|nr:tRNA pseudouridine(13) synthase TruD [Deltaproteobacteria bacterium]